MNRVRVDGGKIRELRKAKGLVLKEAADSICSVSLLSKIETGKADPTEEVLAALAACLEVATDSLLVREDDGDVPVNAGVETAAAALEPSASGLHDVGGAITIDAISEYIKSMDAPVIKQGKSYMSRNERNMYLFLNGMVHKGHDITAELAEHNADPQLIQMFEAGVVLIAKAMAARMKQLDPEAFKKLNRETYLLDIALVHRTDAQRHFDRFYEQDRQMRQQANETLGGDPVSSIAEIVLLKACQTCDGSPQATCAAYEAMDALGIPEWDDNHPLCKYACAGVIEA